jgi:hypothetical protein
MTLNIKDPEAHKLARRIAQQTLKARQKNC